MIFARSPHGPKAALFSPLAASFAPCISVAVALVVGFFALTVKSERASATCVYTNPDNPLTLPSLGSTTPSTDTGAAGANPSAPTTQPSSNPTQSNPNLAPASPTDGPGFAYFAPGDLNPHDKGRGRVGDRKVYLPNIIFPVRLQPGLARTPPGSFAFMNSQIWGYGGGGYNGKGAAGGSEFDARNYDSMMNRDDYCEVRGWPMPMCPAGQGHQGQDIRPPHGDDNKWETQAVVDGVITLVTSNTTVVLKGGDGTEYYYLHQHPDSIKVKVGQVVKQGDTMGRISNFMDGARDTTHHLHFQVSQSISVNGKVQRVYVPPFASLIAAFRKAKGLDPGVDANGMLLIDPTHEYDAQGLLHPATPGAATASLAPAPEEPKFVSWPIPNVSANDGKALPAFSVAKYFHAKDPKAKLNFVATGLPSGLSIDASTGAIKGVVAAGASKLGTNGSYTVLVSADDGAGDTAKQSFIITSKIAPPELIASTRGKFFKDGGWVLIDSGAAFFNPSSAPLVYSAEGLPAGVSINPTNGRISGRLSKTASKGGQDGVYTVTVTATPTEGVSLAGRIYNAVEGNPAAIRDRFTITAEVQKDPNAVQPSIPLPVIASALPSVKVYDGQGITTINAAAGFKPGGDGTGYLTYSAVSLPLALSIDPETGLISGTMSPTASKDGAAGSYTVTVIADNGSGGTASQSFVITSRNLAPILANPTVNKTFAEGEPVQISVGSAFSSPVPETVSYTASGLPPGLALDRINGVIGGALSDGTAKGGANGVYTVTATANDNKGGTATETFTITAQPRLQPPIVIGALAPVAVKEADTITPIDASSVFKSSAAKPGSLVYAAQGLPDALSIDKASGVISGTISAGAYAAIPNGVYVAIVRATDPVSGLFSTQTLTVTIQAPPTPPAPAVQPDAPSPAPPNPSPQPDAPSPTPPAPAVQPDAPAPTPPAPAVQPDTPAPTPPVPAVQPDAPPAPASTTPLPPPAPTPAVPAAQPDAPVPPPAPAPAPTPPAPAQPVPAPQPTVRPSPQPPGAPAQSWTGWAWSYVSGAASTISGWWTGKK